MPFKGARLIEGALQSCLSRRRNGLASARADPGFGQYGTHRTCQWPAHGQVTMGLLGAFCGCDRDRRDAHWRQLPVALAWSHWQGTRTPAAGRRGLNRRTEDEIRVIPVWYSRVVPDGRNLKAHRYYMISLHRHESLSSAVDQAAEAPATQLRLAVSEQRRQPPAESPSKHSVAGFYRPLLRVIFKCRWIRSWI